MLFKCVRLLTVPLLTVEANSLAVSTVISTTLDDWKYVVAAGRKFCVICVIVESIFGQGRTQIPLSAVLFHSFVY